MYGLGAIGLMGLRGVADYQVLVIGGKQYSTSELYGKSPVIIANAPTKVYSSAFDNSEVKYTIPTGEVIGKYSSFLLPAPNRKDTWIELNVGAVGYRYIKAGNVDNGTFKESGVQTLSEQVKKEEEEKEKLADPVTYYFKKLAVPVLGTAAAIYVITQFGKAFITAKVK